MVDTVFFFNDLLHYTLGSAIILTPNTTEAGSNAEYVRDTNLITYWKPTDGTSDQPLKVDGVSTGWLGAAGESAWACIAYDGRAADQNNIILQYDASGLGNFSGATGVSPSSQFSIDKTEMTMTYLKFTIPNPAAQYYRLMMRNADRGGGTKCHKIHVWSMHDQDDVIEMSVDFTRDGIGGGNYRQLSRTARFRKVTCSITNKMAEPGQLVTITVPGGSEGLYQELRDQLWSHQMDNRAFFMQFEGLRNVLANNFWLVRPMPTHTSQYRVMDQYDMVMQFETEPWL